MELGKVFERLKHSRLADRRLVLLLAAVGLPLLLFPEDFTAVILIVFAAASAFLVNYLDLSNSGIEFTTFTTVVFGVWFGPVTGATVGAALSLLQLVFSMHVGIYIFWVVPSYALAGFLAGTLGFGSLLLLGASMTIMLHAIHVFFSLVTMPSHVGRYIPYMAVNTVLNLVLFELATQAGAAALMA